MTDRQKHLIREYARTQNVYAAAAAAFYTTKHIRQTLRALLETEEGFALYQAERENLTGVREAETEPQSAPNIPDMEDAPPEQIRAYLSQYFTSIMCGVVPGSLDTVSVALRTKAATALARLNRLYSVTPEQPIEPPVIVNFPPCANFEHCPNFKAEYDYDENAYEDEDEDSPTMGETGE